MENIELRDIQGYEGLYALTPDGQVWSYRKNRFLTWEITTSGYARAQLYKGGQTQKIRINRLVALHYLPLPEGDINDYDVAHLDDNKLNNLYTNLAWQTRAENLDTERWRQARKNRLHTPIRCVETGEVFPSQAAVARYLNVCVGCVNQTLHGRQKTCKGYHWERVYDEKDKELEDK